MFCIVYTLLTEIVVCSRIAILIGRTKLVVWDTFMRVQCVQSPQLLRETVMADYFLIAI
jgi:hypothetical protein